MFARRTRAKFQPEEDVELRRLVGIHGTSAWEAVARDLPGRSVRQCRERWKHYLSGERDKASWTAEEDRLLYEKMQLLGPKWTRLATFFPGRTDIDIKAHWMQVFAGMSNLHIKNRKIEPPVFRPMMAPPVAPGPPSGAHVQFMGMPARIPQPPTPHPELDWISASRDPSFGSRSYWDLAQWE
jgi:hypothetical protein